jgi:NAD(P)-dependent dehydrogenase (short-subunit alcohol dehydrogenase family)
VRIADRVALVTGGASGLGLAVAQALIDEGASVVLFDLPSSPGLHVAQRLGQHARFAPGNVISETDAVAAVRLAADDFGSLDILVNCAGISGSMRIVGRDGPMPLEHFKRVVEVNLVGTFNVLRLAAAEMAMHQPIDDERGVIVNTASVAAFEGQIGQSPYSASKAGIVGLTLTAARDLASHLIRVVTIAPGTFDTPLLARLSDEVRSNLANAVPHPRRLGNPQEFAQLALHIIANPMLNGETIRLDGAIRMPPR